MKYILFILMQMTMTLGIWWTGLALFVYVNSPVKWDMALLLLWGGVSLFLAYLLMIAVVKWGA